MKANKTNNTELILVQTEKTVCTGCYFFKKGKGQFKLCPKDDAGKVLCSGFKIWKEKKCK